VLEEFPRERLPRGNWPREIAGIPTGSWAAKVGLTGAGGGRGAAEAVRCSEFFLSFSTETVAYNECGDSKRMLTHARGTGLRLIGEQ
jgi:hypothetical protein